jgi:two-component system nitrate/nitrite response regulator NarL
VRGQGTARKINIAIVTDNAIMVDGMRAWFMRHSGVRLVAAAATVDELFLDLTVAPDVVLLDLCRHDHFEPAAEARRLAERYRLLVLGARSELDAASAHAAGALGCVLREQSLAELTAAIRAVAAAPFRLPAGGAGAIEAEPRLVRPRLSQRERAVLVAYASGMTLETAARHIGIRPDTAKTYLRRVKGKYQEAGRPAYTKVELARRVWEDGAAGWPHEGP